MKKRYRVLFFVAFILLGSVISAQFRSIMSQNKEKSAVTLHAEELTAELDKEKESVASLKASVAANEKTMNQNLKAAVSLADDSNTKNELEQLNDAQLKAGLIDVEGQGIIIKLNDALARMNFPQELLVIHDNDIKFIINDLKVAGAQAISINDERLLPNSETICAGPTILVNKNKYPVPYTIKAIGNSDNLYKKMNDSESRIMPMLRDGIRISIEKSKEVTISKYSGKLDTLIQGLEVPEK